MADPEAGVLVSGQEWSRRGIFRLVVGTAAYIVAKTLVSLAQATWDFLPGELLPAVDQLAWLAALIAAFAVVLRLRPRRPAEERGCLPSGMASFVLVAVMICLASAGAGLTTQYGNQSTASLAPTLEKHEHWQANALAYAWRPLQRGDIVAVPVLGWLQGHAVRVVGLPGDLLTWRDGRLELVTPGQTPPQTSLRIPPGQLGVVGDSPWASPLLPISRVRGRVVAVSRPLRNLRSL